MTPLIAHARTAGRPMNERLHDIQARRQEIRQLLDDAWDDGTYDALVDAYDGEYTALYDEAHALGFEPDTLLEVPA